MTVALVFAVLGVLALVAILLLAKGPAHAGGDLDQLASQLRPVDVRAFRNLISDSEEDFLRENVPFWEFRMIHRARMLAAIEYVRCASQNASILIQLAEAAKQSPDSEIVAAGERLLENALRLRIYAIQMIPRLYLAVLFPQMGRAQSSLADAYDTMTRQVVMLGCLQYPTHGMSASL